MKKSSAKIYYLLDCETPDLIRKPIAPLQKHLITNF